jgi:hypothetical protein
MSATDGACLGGVTDQVDAAVGSALGDERDQRTGQVELAATWLVGPPQAGEHRQAHRLRQERQAD